MTYVKKIINKTEKKLLQFTVYNYFTKEKSLL